MTATAPTSPLLTNIVLNTAGAESLTMIAEKQNAHNDEILSVDYNNDGTKIVSACSGGTIKVWGAPPAPDCQPPTSPSLTNLVLHTAGAESLTMIAEKQNAHNAVISSVDYNNDGTKIVSGSRDQTIKVWGAPPAPDCQPQLPHH